MLNEICTLFLIESDFWPTLYIGICYITFIDITDIWVNRTKLEKSKKEDYAKWIRFGSETQRKKE